MAIALRSGNLLSNIRHLHNESINTENRGHKLRQGTTTGGFTLIEMLLVLAVVAILAIMAIPSVYPMKARGQIAESLEITAKLKSRITSLYEATQTFPEDNKQADLPEPDYLIGNFTESTTLENGALHIVLGNKVMQALKGKTLTLQPITVKDSPTSPISWICGYSAVPQGMLAVGQNKTDIESRFLPQSCR